MNSSLLDAILLIDSSEDRTIPLTTLLKELGFKYSILTDPLQLSSSLKTQKYLIIINDANNDLLEKQDYLAKIRKESPKTPVIIITDEKNPVYLVKIANLGVELILDSKLDVPLLSQKINEYVKPIQDPKLTSTLPKDKASSEGHPNENNLKTIFPKTLFFSTNSPNSKTVAQKLWSHFQSANHIFILAPDGSEIELIAKEISEWSNIKKRKILSIQAEHLPTPETKEILEQLAIQTTFSTVIIINDLVQVPQNLFKPLQNFIETGFQKISQGTSITYLYHVNPSGLNNLPDELKSQINAQSIQLLALNKRLADLSFYFQHELAQRAKEEKWQQRPAWSDQAISILLKHPWPNNYDELLSVVKKLPSLDKIKEITPDLILPALGTPNNLPSPIPNLDQYLEESKKTFVQETSQKTLKNPTEILNILETKVV